MNTNYQKINNSSTGSNNPNNKNQSPPQAYQLGHQDFYGFDFIVTPDVLIPRPETEQIIDATLNLLGLPYLPGVKPNKNQLPKNPSILDVGTGSGCIAISLKKLLENAKIDANVSAVDFSEKALKIAQKNAKKHEAKINFKKSDLLKNIDFSPDLILANLPYVDKSWDWIDYQNLSYEPKEALFAENHGLALIFELILESSAQKIKYLLLEADPSQHQEIIAFAKDNNYTLFETRGFILEFKYS